MDKIEFGVHLSVLGLKPHLYGEAQYFKFFNFFKYIYIFEILNLLIMHNISVFGC